MALHRLATHHSRPQYLVRSEIAKAYSNLFHISHMAWNQQWAPRRKSRRSNGGNQDKEKDSNKGGLTLPSYDKADGSAASSSHTGGPAALPTEVMTLLQQIAAKDPNAAATLDGVLPDPDKEDLRQKQRQLNGIRKAQQKIDRKEAAIAKRESQMNQFLEEMKAHIAQERQRFKQDIDTLKKEVDEAKTELQNLKEGKEAKDTIVEDLDAMLDADCEMVKENTALKKQLQQMEAASKVQQSQLYNMQNQMEEFMRQYADVNLVAKPTPSMPPNPLGHGIATGRPESVPPVDPESPQIAMTPRKPQVGPFRSTGMTKPRTSPYGRDGAGELGAMDR